MKTPQLLFILIASLLLISAPNTILFAQDLPVKNGLLYYRFQYKLENKKVCLNKYLNSYDGEGMKFQAKFGAKFNAFATKDNKLWKYTDTPAAMAQLGMIVSQIKKCSDTTHSGAILIPLSPKAPKFHEYFLFYQLVTRNKDKILSQNVKSDIEINFIDKSEYILKIKGLTLSIQYMSGKTEELSLSDLYNAFQKSEKKSKDLIELFNMIDSNVKAVNRILKETLTEAYNLDELD